MASRPTTYDVKLWKTETYKGSKVTTHTVRWAVAGKAKRRSFRTAAMAESFRSDLVVAVRKGEAFEVAPGLPLSMIRRATPVITWYEFACSYIDVKWPGASPKHRKSIAESLVTVTMSMLEAPCAGDEAKAVRSALLNWGFNTIHRESAKKSPRTAERLGWVAAHSRPLSDLALSTVVREVLEAVARKVDGDRAAGRTAQLKTSILSTALDYAVERELLEANPLNSLNPSPTDRLHLSLTDGRS